MLSSRRLSTWPPPPKSNSANDYFKAYAKVEATYFYSPSQEGYEAQVKDRLARWREAQEQALGLEQTETLPDLSESEVLDIKRRTTRRGEND